MKCENCGALLNENTDICSECGACICEKNETSAVVLKEDVPLTSLPKEEDIFAVQPKKKKGGKSIVLAIILSVALIVGVVFVFRPYLVNTAMRLASPQKHQSYVYKNAAKKFSNDFVGTIFDIVQTPESKTNTGTAYLEISDEALALSKSLGIDVFPTALQNIEADYSYSIKNNDQAIKIAPKLPNLEISGELRTDSENSQFSIYVPELNQKPLLMSGDILPVPLLPVTKTVPEKKFTKELLCEYTELLFSNFENITRKNGSYEINGNRVSALCFKTSITEMELKEAFIDLYERAQSDKKLENYYNKKIRPFTGTEESYREFTEKLMAQAQQMEQSDSKVLVLTTFINIKGDIIAIDLSSVNDEELNIFAGLYRRGNSFNCLITAKIKDSDIAVNSKGKYSFGKIDLNTDIYSKGKEKICFEITDLKLSAAKRGNIKGKFRISGSLFAEKLNDVAYGNISVYLDLDCTQKAVSNKVYVMAGEAQIFSLCFDGEYVKAADIKLHNNCVSNKMSWLAGIDFISLLKLKNVLGIELPF
ncbi:MAG: hypothetical protein IKU52_08010 [Clostridia bacterium]|nr:hypothetical protein [Clostridia bacterium]